MILANYAEAPDGGLFYVAGGGWDTIAVQAPIQGAPEGVFAVINGYLMIRLLFHLTETDREHTTRVNIMDDDGQEIAVSESTFPVTKIEGLPTGWLQNLNIVMPLTGIALPHPGNYVINLNVDGQWAGDRQFRVLKQYED